VSYISSFLSLYYPVYHNLPLYTFVPEYFSLFISPLPHSSRFSLNTVSSDKSPTPPPDLIATTDVNLDIPNTVPKSLGEGEGIEVWRGSLLVRWHSQKLESPFAVVLCDQTPAAHTPPHYQRRGMEGVVGRFLETAMHVASVRVVRSSLLPSSSRSGRLHHTQCQAEHWTNKQ